MKDYYKILEISPDTEYSEIKKAYRQLAMRYHPDKNNSPDAPQKFIEITEAYEVLINTDKRQEYDYFYAKFIKPTGLASYEEPTYKEKQANWQNYGQQKAREYSQMDINQFLKIVLDEAVFHGGYLSRIGCITFLFIFSGGFGLVMLPIMFSDGFFDKEDGALSALVIIIVCIVFIFLGIRGVKNEVADFNYEKTNRKK